MTAGKWHKRQQVRRRNEESLVALFVQANFGPGWSCHLPPSCVKSSPTAGSTPSAIRMTPRIKLLSLAIAAGVIAAGIFVSFPRQAHAVVAGQPCGGASGVTCDKGLWCEPAAGKCGATQSAPAAGTCVAVPKLCIARKNGKSFQPVCGCNSKTYSNDCFRRAYKIAKLHDGKC